MSAIYRPITQCVGLLVVGTGLAIAAGQLQAAESSRATEASVEWSPSRLAAMGVVLQRDVEYGRAGDRPLRLDILRPAAPAAQRLPVIVFIHGGAWQSDDKSLGLPRLLPFAASGNYFCVSIDYRLSGEAIWPAQIHDCKAAIRFLRANAEKLGIDPKKIGVWGISAGGHLASLLGTSGDVKELEGDCGWSRQSSRVTCVVDYCGPSDFTPLLKLPAIFTPPPVKALLGGPAAQKAEQAVAASPVSYVSRDDPPFLIVHGTQDWLVPFDQSATLCEKLKQAGVDVTLIKIEGAGHDFDGPELNKRVGAFFDRHLRGLPAQVSDRPIPAGRLRQALESPRP